MHAFLKGTPKGEMKLGQDLQVSIHGKLHRVHGNMIVVKYCVILLSMILRSALGSFSMFQMSVINDVMNSSVGS